VKRFKDRASAVSRTWKAIQSLGNAAQAEETPEPTAEPPATEEHPEPADVPAQEVSETTQPEAAVPESEEPTVTADVAPQTPDVAPEEAPAKNKATRAKKAPRTNDGAPREGSRTSQVIAMLKREGGVTLEEIMTAMGWQKHTTRAMLSAGGSLYEESRAGRSQREGWR